MNHTMDSGPTEKEKERWTESIHRAKENLNQLSDEEQNFIKVIIAEVEKLKIAKAENKNNKYGKEEI